MATTMKSGAVVLGAAAVLLSPAVAQAQDPVCPVGMSWNIAVNQCVPVYVNPPNPVLGPVGPVGVGGVVGPVGPGPVGPGPVGPGPVGPRR
jgi:hypothetical protein